MSLSDYLELKLLDHSVGKASFTMPATVHVGLFTAAPGDAGGGTEVTGGSYARKQTAAAGADWNAAASGQITNANALAFVTPTADWGTVEAFGIFDLGAGGNLLWWDWMGDFGYVPFVCDDAAGSPDVFDSPAHGLAANDRVVFTSEFGGTLPTGLTAGTLYHVIAGGLTTDSFAVSTTQGGSAVAISAIGSGMYRKVVPQVIQNGNTVQFNAGQLKLQLR
jgi:hypothetical protein